MKHASVFSGIEGFGLAALWAGIETVFSCEINGFCREVININFPKAIIYEDVRDADFSIWRGKIDILTAGFPCQPFSVAGQRKGSGDDRYHWPSTRNIIDIVRPPWFIGENVAGITSMVQPGEVVSVENHSDLFGEDNYTIETERAEYVIETVCRDLEGIGYSVQPFVIPACAVGAPHRRDRIWFVAHSDSVGWQRRCSGCNGENEDPSQRTDVFSAFRKHGEEQSSPNSSNTGSEGLQCQGKNRTVESRATADASSEWRRELRDKGEKERARCSYELLARKYPIPNWDNFPTVSPIHTRNDGVSSELLRQRIREDSMGLLSEKEIDKIFSKANTKLREEGVKASGNAIVPQVAYQIIRAIVDIENSIK